MLFRSGGKNEDGTISKEFRSSDIHEVEWKELKMMPEGRYDCAATYLNDFLYVTGGYDEKGTRLSNMVRFNLKTRRWSSGGPCMLEPRSGHQLISSNGCLYAIGGNSRELEEFIPELNRWKVIEYLPVVDLSTWTSAAACEKKILIIVDEKMYSFDVDSRILKFEKNVPARSKIVSVEDNFAMVTEDGSIKELKDNFDFKNKQHCSDVVKGNYLLYSQYEVQEERRSFWGYGF